MRKYKVCFSIGSGSTYFYIEFDHCYKHDTEEDFEKDLDKFARNIGATYLYKEPV